MEQYSRDEKSALESIELAQWIAFAPVVFQATVALRDLGILSAIEGARRTGLTLEQIREKTGLTTYGVRVLLEAGLGIGLVTLSAEHYKLTKTAYFILNDRMTQVNLDFTKDICYQGMHTLTESVRKEEPTGLKTLGPWKTLYEGLSLLPPRETKSWFDFDHFYSDGSFPVALPIIFRAPHKHILDIGGNTGKFSLQAVKFNPDVKMTILDLPGQLGMAEKNIASEGYSDRIAFHPINILEHANKFPKGADGIWMSQFLDCFSESQIISILERCREALADGGKVYIMETFWDRQRYKAGAFSLQMTSLYFTNIANGNSQMYDSEVFKKLIERAGLRITEEFDEVGISHTILVCTK